MNQINFKDMEKQEFIKRYNDVRESVINAMDKTLTRAIGNDVIDFDKCIGNYLDVYPLIGAVLKRELRYILEGSPYDNVKRLQKRKATEYEKNYRVWQDYAGDYRTKNEITDII